MALDRAVMTASANVAHSCGCIGPQNGQPLCPCMMRSVTIENGRYVQKRDLGPAHTGGSSLSDDWDRIEQDFKRLVRAV